MRASHLLLIFLVIGLIHLDLIDARKKGKKGKKGNKGKKGKGGKKPKPLNTEQLFGEHTLSSDCQCWFDLTKHNCGCCKGDAVQCGDPMGKYCWKPPQGKPMGCPGIIQNKYTLSQRGHPCFWDHGDRNCAFCVPGSYKSEGQAFQCGPGPKTDPAEGKNHCFSNRRPAYCDMHLADCKTMGKGICDVNAECKRMFKDKNGYSQAWKCKCNPGWTSGAGMPYANKTTDFKLTTLDDGGHGLACQNDDGTFSEVGDKVVEVEMELTLDTIYAVANSSFSSGPAQESLLAAMTALIDAGKPACSGCDATLVSYENNSP